MFNFEHPCRVGTPAAQANWRAWHRASAGNRPSGRPRALSARGTGSPRRARRTGLRRELVSALRRLCDAQRQAFLGERILVNIGVDRLKFRVSKVAHLPPLALQRLRAASKDRAEVPREQAGGDCLHHLAPRACRMGVRGHPADVRAVARRGERQRAASVVGGRQETTGYNGSSRNLPTKISGSGVRNPDGALSVKIRYAARRLAGVARPGSVGVARRSVGALRRVRDAGWPPGAGQSKRRDPGHAACGSRRIPPSSRFRRRGRAVIAVAPSPGLCRRHRSRRHHRINHRKARAVSHRANRSATSAALPEQGTGLSLGLVTSPQPRPPGKPPDLALATIAQ